MIFKDDELAVLNLLILLVENLHCARSMFENGAVLPSCCDEGQFTVLLKMFQQYPFNKFIEHSV